MQWLFKTGADYLVNTFKARMKRFHNNFSLPFPFSIDRRFIIPGTSNVVASKSRVPTLGFDKTSHYGNNYRLTFATRVALEDSETKHQPFFKSSYNRQSQKYHVCALGLKIYQRRRLNRVAARAHVDLLRVM